MSDQPATPPGVDFRETEIASLTHGLVIYVSKEPLDIGIKIAALRAAADVLQRAVNVRTFTEIVRNTLDPKGRS